MQRKKGYSYTRECEVFFIDARDAHYPTITPTTPRQCRNGEMRTLAGKQIAGATVDAKSVEAALHAATMVQFPIKIKA